MKQYLIPGLALVLLLSCGCKSSRRLDPGKGEGERASESDKTTLGSARVGKEVASFYIAYGFDSAVLGFSVSTGSGPARYFPIHGSTYRGIPSVVLEVFTSKAEDEMWVRSSWPGNEILAYRRIGSETTTTQWGEMGFITEPMPKFLSGGSVPFPKLDPQNAVKKATFKSD